MLNVYILQARSAPRVEEHQLPPQEMVIIRQMMQNTGISNVGVIRQALRLLSSMPQHVVHTLGQMDPMEIQRLVSDRAKQHGVDASKIMGLMGMGGGGGGGQQQGMPQRMQQGMPQRMPQGMQHGMPQGMPPRGMQPHMGMGRETPQGMDPMGRRMPPPENLVAAAADRAMHQPERDRMREQLIQEEQRRIAIAREREWIESRKRKAEGDIFPGDDPFKRRR